MDKVYARWIPRVLKEEERDRRVTLVPLLARGTRGRHVPAEDHYYRRDVAIQL